MTAAIALAAVAAAFCASLAALSSARIARHHMTLTAARYPIPESPGPLTVPGSVEATQPSRAVRRPRRRPATVARAVLTLAAAGGAWWVTGHGTHWPVLAVVIPAAGASLWLTRRWR